jgi:hypothetical protein
LLQAVPGVPASPRPHAPVAPQFVVLERGSTQLPPQSICDPGHDTWQLPFAQTLPLLHAVPAFPVAPASPRPHPPLAPQFELLVRGSTHTPPQLISLPGQETWQVPFPHTFPIAQATPALPPPLPHRPVAPQLPRLVVGSTQTPPQSISLPGQATWQLPLLHTVPVLHAVPALPASPTPHPGVAPQ